MGTALPPLTRAHQDHGFTHRPVTSAAGAVARVANTRASGRAPGVSRAELHGLQRLGPDAGGWVGTDDTPMLHSAPRTHGAASSETHAGGCPSSCGAPRPHPRIALRSRRGASGPRADPKPLLQLGGCPARPRLSLSQGFSPLGSLFRRWRPTNRSDGRQSRSGGGDSRRVCRGQATSKRERFGYEPGRWRGSAGNVSPPQSCALANG